MKKPVRVLPNELSKSLERFKQDLTYAISTTPTGDNRNDLTDLQLLIGSWETDSYKEAINGSD